MENDIFYVKQVLNGQIESFEQLMIKYEKLVYNMTLRILGNPDDAADATQEAFIKSYNALSSFRNDAKFSTWVCRIAMNICYDLIRKRKRHEVVPLRTDIQDDNIQLDIPDPDLSTDPLAEITQSELREAIAAAIVSLDQAQQEVMILRDIQGLSYQEISKQLGIAEGTVKSRLNRARLKVAKLLQKQAELLPHDLRHNK